MREPVVPAPAGTRVVIHERKEPPPPQREPAPAPQIGAEGEIYDPPFFRKGTSRPDGTSGFGPMASSDFGTDLDIPTVIRNLSD